MLHSVVVGGGTAAGGCSNFRNAEPLGNTGPRGNTGPLAQKIESDDEMKEQSSKLAKNLCLLP
jgi:hypothetical protein